MQRRVCNSEMIIINQARARVQIFYHGAKRYRQRSDDQDGKCRQQKHRKVHILKHSVSQYLDEKGKAVLHGVDKPPSGSTEWTAFSRIDARQYRVVVTYVQYEILIRTFRKAPGKAYHIPHVPIREQQWLAPDISTSL